MSYPGQARDVEIETMLQDGDAATARSVVASERELILSSGYHDEECEECGSQMAFSMGIGGYKCRNCGALYTGNLERI